MEVSLIIIILIMIISLVVVARGALTIKENQRIVVLRLGKHENTLGPGLVLIIPFIDQPIYVNLTKHVPEWRSMSENDIKKQVEDIVLLDPDPNKYK